MSDLTVKEMFSKLREDFPMLRQTMHGHPLIYFDSAATTQKPEVVIEEMNNFYRNHYGTVHRAVYELSLFSTERYRQVRKNICDFIHAKKPYEIIYTRGTTESINQLAYSFGKAFIRPGDEILISELEHHSNIVPWQIVCEDRGAVLKVIPINDTGEIDLESYRSLLSEKTKLVAVAHISNALGTVNPVEKMISIAHDAGAKVFVDGAQAAPHIPVDVQALDADFYAFSGHKMFGPTGVGILYGKEELLDAMPPCQGGGDMIKHVTFEKTEYNDLPFKFEAGTPMIVEVIGLGKAIEYLQHIGMEKISAWESDLLNLATKKIQEVEGVQIIGNAKEKGAIISFVAEKIHPLDLGTMLDLSGAAVRTGHHCAQPVMKRFGVNGTTRASFALYNTLEEVDQFIEILINAIKKLR